MDAVRLQAKADLGDSRGRLAGASTAVQAEGCTGFRPILTEQEVHGFVQSLCELGKSYY